MDLLLEGKALPEDADDFIDMWHDSAPDSAASQLQLHDFLGMSWDEYALWIERPISLRWIVSARDRHEPLDLVISQASQLALAARAEDAKAAREVYEWLKETGRVDD